MAFLKVKKEVVEKAGGSTGIFTSGLYPVTIKAVTVDVNEKGARTVGLFVNYEGNDQMLYGALPLDLYDNSKTLDNNVETLMRLAVIAGEEELADTITTELPIGKGKAMKEVDVIENIEDIECQIWIKQEYNLGNNGKMYESRILKNIFTVDGASADEITNESEVGVKLEKQRVYFDGIKYKNTDADQVQAWIDADRPDTVSGGTSSAPAGNAAPKASFGKKGSKFGTKSN